MSNPPPDAGSKRAADFNEALLDMPGYADDTIFFLVRYIERCKRVLRKADYDDFMAKLTALGNFAAKENPTQEGNGDEAAAAVRSEKRDMLRRQALEKIDEYPDLVGDFERFTAASKRMAAAMNQK